MRPHTPDHVQGLTYLDFAATSAVRPPAVAQAVARFIDDVGSTPGRAGHRLAVEAGRVALRCRQAVARLLGIPGDPGQVAFAANATHAINTALWGTVSAGDAVVVTTLDHNAVLRPAAHLARERGIDVRLVPADSSGALDEDVLLRALQGARIFAINAASNVLGTVQDVARLCSMARAHGALSLVDAAQVAGHAPFDAAASGADMIAFSGHKGMLGPQGIGGLWVRAGLDVAPLITGGTGGDSLQRDMPRAMPDRLEAGTQNGPAMAGLTAGIEFLLGEGVAAMHTRLGALKQRLRDALLSVDGVTVLSPPGLDGVPIVLVRSDVVDAATLAARLDREHGVLVRSGLHCAPEAHRVLGTCDVGAVRFSLGWCTTAAHVDHAASAVSDITATGGRAVRSTPA